jgi:hypothetical protein
VICLLVILIPQPQWAADAPMTQTEATELASERESLTKFNKELSNPVSSLWSLSSQQNNFYLDDVKVVAVKHSVPVCTPGRADQGVESHHQAGGAGDPARI